MFSVIDDKRYEHHAVASIRSIEPSKKKCLQQTVYFYPGLDESNDMEGFSPRIEAQNAVVSLIPRTTQRSIYYIAGKSGVGKSTWASNLACSYHLLFPKNKIYVISAVDKDAAFDKYKFIKRFKVDELVEDPLTVEEIPNSLVIMDDLETLPKKKLEAINLLRDQILTKGRHTNTSICLLYHSLFDGHKSRLMISEQDVCTFYPQSSAYQPSKFMKTYCGLSQSQIKCISSVKSRWITYVNSYYKPFIIYEYGLSVVEGIDKMCKSKGRKKRVYLEDDYDDDTDEEIVVLKSKPRAKNEKICMPAKITNKKTPATDESDGSDDPYEEDDDDYDDIIEPKVSFKLPQKTNIIDIDD